MRAADVHPRPLLVRSGWADLCGRWDFAHDDGDVGLAERWHRSDRAFDRTIMVPFPPESPSSGIRARGHHPVVWYRLRTKVPDLARGHRLLLHFGAVDYHATVWVDGMLVGTHEGGHTPFSCDVTHALASTRRHTIVVRAQDDPADGTQPRGKQDWRGQPHEIWYHRTTGIWQPVWFEQVPETHVQDLQWTPDVPAGRVRMELRLNRAPRTALTVAVRLRLGDEELAEHHVVVHADHAVADIAVPGLGNAHEARRLLWSPESPRLVEADVTVRERDTTVDTVGSYLGLRSVAVRDGRFWLNDDPCYVRGVLAQGYWPESHLAAPGPEALRREVELVKELGFNTVRVHQKAEDPRFLYWCDRLGLLVWGETANAYEFGATAVERLVREWLEVVRRDRSHPCIVTWLPMNESWGAPHMAVDEAQRSYSDALYHLTRSVDPTRPVLSNDGWEHSSSDIVGVHDYAPRGDLLRERYTDEDAVERTLRAGPAFRSVRLPGHHTRGRPVMLTEFGGVRSSRSRLGRGWGYSQVSSARQLADRLAELVDAVLDSTVLAGFCYTQLTDTEQEQNGLLTADRKPKIPPRRVRRIIGRAARSIPSEALSRPTSRPREDP